VGVGWVGGWGVSTQGVCVDSFTPFRRVGLFSLARGNIGLPSRHIAQHHGGRARDRTYLCGWVCCERKDPTKKKRKPCSGYHHPRTITEPSAALSLFPYLSSDSGVVELLAKGCA
jgi:hypothetical protein